MTVWWNALHGNGCSLLSALLVVSRLQFTSWLFLIRLLQHAQWSWKLTITFDKKNSFFYRVGYHGLAKLISLACPLLVLNSYFSQMEFICLCDYSFISALEVLNQYNKSPPVNRRLLTTQETFLFGPYWAVNSCEKCH